MKNILIVFFMEMFNMNSGIAEELNTLNSKVILTFCCV